MLRILRSANTLILILDSHLILLLRMSQRQLVERTWAALDAFSVKWGGATPRQTFAVALSGGPDSTALAHLYQRWLARRFPAERNTVEGLCVVVNHNLRRGSGEEAAAVAERARRMGMSPAVRSLGLESDTQQAARDGRLLALLDAALERGTKAILTGHTKNDQMETFVLRTLRGSGVRGLAGIPSTSVLSYSQSGELRLRTLEKGEEQEVLLRRGDPAIHNSDRIEAFWSSAEATDSPSSHPPPPPCLGSCSQGEVCVHRPFLGVGKSALLRYCKENDLEYVVDPSNASMDYTRNAIRNHFGTLNEGVGADASFHGDLGTLHSLFADTVCGAHAERLALIRDQAVHRVDPPASTPEVQAMELNTEVLRSHPSELVEDMLLDLVHSTTGRRKKLRLRAIEKLLRTMLLGKGCVLNGITFKPVPRTEKKRFLLTFRKPANKT